MYCCNEKMKLVNSSLDDSHKIKSDIKEESEALDNPTKEESTDDDEYKLVIKDEPGSQDEADDAGDVNISAASSCDYNLSQFKKEESQFSEGEDQLEEDVKVEPKEEPDSDEDIPLSARMSSSKRKMESEEDDDDDVPLTARKKPKTEKKEKKKKKKRDYDDEEEEEDDYKPDKKIKKEIKKEKTNKKIKMEVESPKKGGRKKKEEEEPEVWKWWEEEKKDDGVKWKFLEHKGPVFAPPYEPLPKDVKFYYDGKEVQLSQDAEEVAGFYAKMLEHDYTTKEVFNKNFFKDWRKVMTEKERELITDLKKCNFRKMHAYFMDQSEKNKNRTKEEKQQLKEKNEALMKEYGYCTIDGHKEKIGNFRIEPPGLFRGRGEHPKMGKLKKRLEAEDIIINCSKDSVIPEPPEGHRWKEVRHVNTVTWLASWTENVQNQVKYIMLNPSSKLKGEKDWQKYETARRLHKSIDKIRNEYQRDWKSKEMKIRQRAVALYFIDKLALRAGNEKDEDQADTVGCCSLRVEHIELHEKRDDKEYVVVFDFPGKDSIRYYNEVPVEKRVFKNLQLFMENKKNGDDLFDRLNTAILNKHLNELMEGLTAKVFRTYNASWTLQQQLDLLTNEDDTVAEKILAYNRANRAVAILCNHQRSVPKSHEKSMEKLKEKIDAKREAIKDAERQVKDAVRDAKHGSVKEKVVADKKKKLLQRLKEQLGKLEIQETDRDENKTIALGTSKLNYLDPRISVAWCKKYDVPLDKIYNKTQRDKFRWAIDMAGLIIDSR
ncbi:DNA topoisomerase 1 isoform X2 [Leptinotarsa decemlineata]|uniref:DNA topoisomerase 1 isoform X2 n=1 Tax=Leptinotarsa decemlineata TaxID=7539 RepID=UPI003D30C202